MVRSYHVVVPSDMNTVHTSMKKSLKAVGKVQPLPTPAATTTEGFPGADGGRLRRPHPMGMFDGLQPFVFVALLYGNVPHMRLAPRPGPRREESSRATLVGASLPEHRRRLAGFSLRALCSTWPWVVAVNAVVLYSVCRTTWDRALQLQSLSADQVHDRFVAITSLLVTTVYLLVPVFWIEVPRGVRRLIRLTAPLMGRFGHLVGRCGPLPGLMAWSHMFMCLVGAPFLVWAWLFVIAQEGRGSDWTHLPAGTFNIVLCYTLTSGHVAVFLRMADFADQMAQQMAAEIASGKMRAPRLREFRASWLDLSELLRSAAVLTVIMFVYMALLTALSIFFTFQFLVALRGGSDPYLVTSVFVQAFLWNVSSFAICMSAHHFASKVNIDFEKALRVNFQLEYPLMDSETERELTFFLRITSQATGAVSVGGFFELRRRTFISLASAMVSNLIVLIQLEQSH